MAKKVMMVMGISVIFWILVSSGCAPKAQPALAPADFYKGKTIELVVSDSPGGTTDLTSRFIVSYLSGDTRSSVVVINNRGAGGLEGMNYIYKSNPDGLTLGTVASAKFVPNKVLNEPAAEYELENFSYIMSVGARQRCFYISPDGPYQSIADLQAGKDLKICGSSPSGPISLGGLTIIKILGLDAKVITGFSGGSERALAVKRGEVIGTSETISVAADYVGAGIITPMFILATERDPLMPDVPAITELVDLTGEDLALVELWEKSIASSTLLIAPPGIPEDRLEFLRGLAEKWVQDEGFRDGINSITGYEVQEKEYVTGEAVTQTMLDMAADLDTFQSIFIELIEKYRA